MSTPAEHGFRLPSDAHPHERCCVAWPAMRRADLWNGHLGGARDAVAIIARAIAEYEPVTVVADEGEGRAAEQWLGGGIEVIEVALDHTWLRDTGPVTLVHDDGRRATVGFRFTGWAGRSDPGRDADLAARLGAQLGLPAFGDDDAPAPPLALEAGAVVTDGAGTVITSEQSLLHPGRNPGLHRDEVEAALQAWLGATRVIWLTTGLADTGTEGHVDDLVAFVDPGRVVVQTTTDQGDPDFGATREAVAVLEAAGLEVTVIDVLPHVDVFDRVVEVPYLDLYAIDRAVFVPLAGAAADKAVLRRLERAFPGRDVVGLPGRVLAYGGGGIHRVTLPVPAAG